MALFMLQDTFFETKNTLNCRGKIINLSAPVVMGVINVGPDSFYDGGKYRTSWDIIKQAGKLIEEGAAIIDVGAASTRPGAALVDSSAERRYVMPAIETLVKEFPDAILSIDTYNADTANEAINAGAHIINDISAGEFDSGMFSVVAQLQVPYVIMHIKGKPANMQQNPVYTDIVKEIAGYFAEKIFRLREEGVHDIIIDPGFGFGKSLEDNYRLLNMLDYFKIFELPILVGFSRKSMINKVLGTSPEKALNGTTVLNTVALQKGAGILRVHDALEAAQAIQLIQMLHAQND
ncbi:MAG: dihydropteroate synthase [Bacteroidetes bacterium]|nr:MAG: dihydropteroate synthase [Bacteroidota bacterium]